jgi:hypothetical protein
LILRRCLLSLSIPAMCFAVASAQQGSTGTLNGVVKDPSGAVVPGATVVVTDMATNVTTTTTTTGAGVYTFPTLPPARYRIAASHTGFRSTEIVDVPLRVAQLLSVSLTMQVGGGTETVTVSGNAQLLETSTAQLSHYLTAKEMLSWPIPVTGDGERQLQDFIFKSLPGTTGETYLGSINGGQYFSNEIYIDGISLGTFDTAEMGPSMDAVGEFNLQTGSMGAQYNGGGTAVSNFSIHSGTNKLHGGAYEYFQNEALNANSYDDDAADQIRPKQRLNNFGATLGGPVVIPHLYNGHNRTFFFFSYEQTIKRNFTFEGKTSMPTQPMLAGDLSGFLDPAQTNDARSGQQAVDANGNPVVDALGRPVIFGQVYDPSTTRLVQAGTVDPITGRTVQTSALVRDPFTNNQIPTTRFDASAAKYLNLSFPTNFINKLVVGNLPAYANNQPVFNQEVYSWKIDHQISAAHKASFYMSWVNRHRYNSGASTWSVPGSNPLDTWDIQNNPGKIVRASEYWTITPRLLNHFAIGYNRFTNEYKTDFSSQNWAQQFGLQNLPSSAFPTVSFTGSNSSLGSNVDSFGNSANGSGNISQSTIFSDQLSYIAGAHSLQFGTEWRFYNLNDVDISGQPNYQFSNNDTDDGIATTNYSGNAFASFLLGQVNNTGRTIYPGTFGFRRQQVGTFLQDDWKVSPRLSLNLGLRWEVLTGIKANQGRMTTFAPNLPNAGAGNLPGSLEFASQLHKNTFENTDWGLILPRFGFAYSASPVLVFRGGFGVNTQSPEGGPELQAAGDPSTLGYTGQIQVNQSTNPQPYSDISPFTLSNPYPAYNAALPNYDPTQANLGVGASAPAYVRPDGARVAYVENYNFGIQYAIGHQTVAEVNYVGNTTKRLYAYGTDELDQLPIGDLALYGGALLDPLSAHPEIPMPYAGFSTNNSVQQALAPFPQYAGGSLIQYDSHLGWSRYDSLQATITRHVTTGLSMLAAYTWSKTMTNTNTNFNSGLYEPVQDVHNLKLEKAVAIGIDVPQQAKVTAIYDFPFGAGRRYRMPTLLDAPLGGWTVSANLLYQSGAVLAISDSGVNNGIFATTRPNYTGKTIKLDSPGGFNYANPAASPLFLNPAAFTHVPTSAVNDVALTVGNVSSALGHDFGPGLADENFSLQKNFAFGESRSIQIRADALNALNRAGRGNPVTDINNPLFGKITGPGTDSQNEDSDSYWYQPRVVQLAARISF